MNGKMLGNMDNGFAIWITGLPASGKSTLARELSKKLRERGLPVVVLESDEMRSLLTPDPSYSPEERDRFYRALAGIGGIITRNGGNVIFDATANRRSYRNHARLLIQNFFEVFIDCPLEVCIHRDPKGIYARATTGSAESVPGIQAVYEQPLNPEMALDCRSEPSAGAELIIHMLTESGILPHINRF